MLPDLSRAEVSPLLVYTSSSQDFLLALTTDRCNISFFSSKNNSFHFPNFTIVFISAVVYFSNFSNNFSNSNFSKSLSHELGLIHVLQTPATPKSFLTAQDTSFPLENIPSMPFLHFEGSCLVGTQVESL